MSNAIEKLLERLPRHFNVEEQTNNYKLLSIIAEHSNDNQRAMDTILRFWDVDFAQGVGLDRLGKDEGIAREGIQDDEYRKMIKIQYVLNMSDGDIPTMNLILDAYFGKNFIGLQEGWRVFDEPATLLANLHEIPFNIPYKMLKRLKPAGVGMILGTKQKLDLGLNIGGAHAAYQQTKITVPQFKMDDLQSLVSTALVNASYKVSSINIKDYEMPDSSNMQLHTGLLQGNYNRTKIDTPHFTMPDAIQAPSLFSGVFSTYKKTTIMAKG